MKRKTLLAIYIVITSTLSVFGILVFLLLASGGNLKPSDLQGFLSAYVPTIQLISYLAGVTIAGLAYSSWKSQQKHKWHYEWLIESQILVEDLMHKTGNLFLIIQTANTNKMIQDSKDEWMKKMSPLLHLLKQLEIANVSKSRMLHAHACEARRLLRDCINSYLGHQHNNKVLEPNYNHEEVNVYHNLNCCRIELREITKDY